MSTSLDVRVLEEWSERGMNGRRVSFRVEAHGDILLFCAGSRTWELNEPELVFRFEPYDTPVTSVFLIERAGRREYVFRYPHLGRAFAAKIDPTYDALDFSMDHKLSAIAEFALSPGWREKYLEQKRRQHSAA